MTVHFVIGLSWVEFFCHLTAAFFYISGGAFFAENKESAGVITIVSAIALTAIGAHL